MPYGRISQAPNHSVTAGPVPSITFNGMVEFAGFPAGNSPYYIWAREAWADIGESDSPR
jgi:hypothetical protein